MTDWLLIAVRHGLYAALMVLFGVACFALYALGGDERHSAFDVPRWLTWSTIAGLFLSAALLILVAAGMAGTTPVDVDRGTIIMVATAPGVGTAFLVRIGALLLALLVAQRAASVPALVIVAAAGGLALASLAWNGHGAMGEGAEGWTYLGADIAHLFAAGIWIGALIALVLLVTHRSAHTARAHLILSHRALHGFSRTGTLAVGTIVLTGLINAWVLVGPENVASLGETLYGRLLLAKLVLFGFMLVLAALNRFQLTPAFAGALNADNPNAALMALRRSLAAETACAIAILGLIAWAGTLAPPAAGV